MNEKTDNGCAVAEFTFADARLLKTLFQAISRFTDEPVFRISEDAITIREMDVSRVSMLDYTIPKHVFEEYRVHTLGTFCFNIEDVIKVAFSKLTKDTTVKVFIDGKDGRIRFTLEDTRTRKRSFMLLESTIEDAPTPKLMPKAHFMVMAKQWQDDILDLAKISNHVTLIGTRDMLKVIAEGDVSHAENMYKRGGDTLLDTEIKEESKASYSTSYLTEVGVDPKLCDIADLEFSTDMPLKIRLRNAELGELYHYMAPRIEVD